MEAKLPVLLRCLNPKCPRTHRINKDDFMPNGTAEVRQLCPRHMRKGGKTYPVEYYDKDGKEIDQSGWTEVHS